MTESVSLAYPVRLVLLCVLPRSLPARARHSPILHVSGGCLAISGRPGAASLLVDAHRFIPWNRDNSRPGLTASDRGNGTTWLRVAGAGSGPPRCGHAR